MTTLFSHSILHIHIPTFTSSGSTPLDFFVGGLEGAGFEVKGIDTIGVHYSATMWRWYRNWLANREKVEAKYGKRWFRVSFQRLIIWRWSLHLLTNNRSGNTSWPSLLLLRDRELPPATRLFWSRTSTRPTALKVCRLSSP